MSKVAVVIPTYNQARYFSKCIKSVLKQTRKADEIIVVDDASEDNTSKIINKYKNELIYIKHKKNLGTVKTFNDGIKKASSDYILMVSGDDWLKSDIIQKEKEILDKNPKVALVYAQSYIIENNIKKLIIHNVCGKKSYIARNNDFELLLTKGDFIAYLTAMVRRDVYKKLGYFNERLSQLHDHELWIRIAKNYPLAYIAQPLAYYRVHGQNLHLKNDFSKSYEQEFAFILKKHFSGKLNHRLKSIKKEAYHRYFLSLSAMHTLPSAPWSKFLNYWYKAVKIKPLSIFSPNIWLLLLSRTKKQIILK